MICLPPNAVEKFRQAVINGKLNPEHLANMSSEARHEFLSKIVGEGDAKTTNALFESKLLLKNQQQGYISWARRLTNVSPAVKRDLISRIGRMDERILNPASQRAFMKDLAETKLGVGVSATEAKEIASLSDQLKQSNSAAEQSVKKSGYTKASEPARIQAGVDRVTLEKYIADKKALASKKTLGQTINPNNLMKGTKSLLGATKGLVASFTSHAPLKHGFMALFEDPKDWLHNYATQFSDAAKQVSGKDVMDAIKAEGYSRENSINGIYDKWIPGELSKGNEEFHSDLPSKVPVLGRLYKGSKTMFDGFNLKMRMDLVDHYVNIVRKMGLDPLDNETAKAWGKLAIDQTGGKTTNPDNLLGNFLFSQRLLKAEANNLTMHIFDKTATKAVKVQSAKTLAKVVMGVGAVMATANALRPGTVEFDPRSSNAGKIKIGDTRFDIEGGYGSIITLSSRIAAAVDGKPAVKSSSTNILTKLGSGFGQTSYQTLLGDFLQGRASPGGQIIADLANGQTFAGTKPTVKSELGTATTPIPIQTYGQLKNDPHSANTLATMLAQQLGLMSNTYGQSKATPTWDSNTSKGILQFKQKVGNNTFQQAAQSYDQQYQTILSKAKGSTAYQNMSPTDQQKYLTEEKAKIKSDVFKTYSFKPTKAKKNSLLQAVK